MASARGRAPAELVAVGLEETEWRDGLDNTGRQRIKRKLKEGGKAEDVLKKVRRMVAQHAAAHTTIAGAASGEAGGGGPRAAPGATPAKAAPGPAAASVGAPGTAASPDRRLAEQARKLAVKATEVSSLALAAARGRAGGVAMSAKPGAQPLAPAPPRLRAPPPAPSPLATSSQHRVWPPPLPPGDPPGKHRQLDTWLDEQTVLARALRTASEEAAPRPAAAPSPPAPTPRPPVASPALSDPYRDLPLGTVRGMWIRTGYGWAPRAR